MQVLLYMCQGALYLQYILYFDLSEEFFFLICTKHSAEFFTVFYIIMNVLPSNYNRGM